VLRLSGRDLKDFYYLLEVDESRWSKQAWGPRVPKSWFEDLEDESKDDCEEFDEWWASDLEAIRIGKGGTPCPAGFVQPLAKTLVMGGSQCGTSSSGGTPWIIGSGWHYIGGW
jgi:hypothetical protein